jgi:hypothetical protein
MLFSACQMQDSNDAPLLIFSAVYDFNDGEQGWNHGFADYPVVHDSTLYALEYAYQDEPSGTAKSVKLSSNNVNGDVFMYLKKQVTGLKPNTEYTITFNIELGLDANVGGAAVYESVYLKAGATHLEPKTVIESGYYTMNIDKGNHEIAGEDMTTLGVVLTPENSSGYSIIKRNNTMTNSRYTAKSNGNGDLWLIIGTDSGFAGITTLYYTKVNVVFSAS